MQQSPPVRTDGAGSGGSTDPGSPTGLPPERWSCVRYGLWPCEAVGMRGKKHTADAIGAELRQGDGLAWQGRKVAVSAFAACRLPSARTPDRRSLPGPFRTGSQRSVRRPPSRAARGRTAAARASTRKPVTRGNGAVFCMLKEARVVIEHGRRHDIRIRAHALIGDRRSVTTRTRRRPSSGQPDPPDRHPRVSQPSSHDAPTSNPDHRVGAGQSSTEAASLTASSGPLRSGQD